MRCNASSWSGRHRARRYIAAVACVIAALAATVLQASGAAASTAVSNVTVGVASPSAAAGALTTYQVGFQTSASGGLSGNAGSTITIVLPAGTGLDNLASTPVMVGANQVGGCFVDTGTTITCDIFGGLTVAANKTVAVALNGVNNSTTVGSTYTVQVSTSSDTSPVTSPQFAITAAHPIANVTVGVASPSAAAGALTTYQVGFQTSASGGLSGNAGSTITIVLPAGTGLDNLASTPVMVGANQVGGCFVDTGTTITCDIFGGLTVAANKTVAVALNGVNNSTTVGSTYTVQVSTSSDTSPVTSPQFAITAAHPIANVTVGVASPSAAAGALTTYQVGFQTSASGGLSGNAGSTITIVLPAGTGLDNLASTPVMVGANQVGGCFVDTGTTITCDIFGGLTVAANKTVAVALNGVNNSTTVGSTYTVQVSTSSDTSPVTSPQFAITAAESIASASVALTKTLPSATGVTYKLKVKTSATGGLSGDAGSAITIVLPAGTGLNNLTNSWVTVGANQVGGCFVDTGTTITCDIFGGTTVAGKTSALITLGGIRNPATANVYTAKVSTSSDTTTKATPGYCVVAAGVPCIAGVTPATGGVGAAVTISGVNLSGASSVAFHGTLGTILSNSASKITTTVPAGATSGSIVVTVGALTTTSPTIFKVIPAPTITGFSPSAGPVGTTVTISGTNLAKATSVTFDGVSAIITTDTAAQITTAVPAGATTGPISVTNAGGTTTTSGNFTVT